MSSDIRRHGLAAEKQALDLYLNSMYDDVAGPEEGVAATVISLVPEAERVAGKPLKESVQPTVEELQSNAQQDDSSSLANNLCPQQDMLQVLLFNLYGLNMAILMSELDSIVDWPEKLATTPDSSPLYLGMLRDEAQEIPVIDLARLIVPARLREQQAPPVFERILIIADRRWGLACHGVAEAVSVEPSAVNWRSERISRKWLAGTIRAHGSALLDTAALEHLLQQSD